MFDRGKVVRTVNQFLWVESIDQYSWWKIKTIWFLRLLYVLGQDIAAGQLTLRAMSLVFTTLLAMVPLLAVSFSVLKAFGGHNMIEPMLAQFLQPLGEKGTEITDRVIGFVDNIKVGVLGSLGLLFLFYAVVSLIQKVESAFNYIWQLHQSRTLLRRFSDYLSVIFVGPVLVFTALGLSAAIKSATLMQKLLAIEPFGVLFNFISYLMPYVLIISAFTFVYKFIPNTLVKFKAALFGGLISGVVWQSCSWVFAAVVVTSTQYTAIYSSFAILIIFMIWIYLNWLILLLGSSITYFRQYPDNLIPNRHKLNISIVDQERVALDLLYIIGERYYRRDNALTIFELAERLSLPLQLVRSGLSILKKGRLISKTSKQIPTYIPAVPLDAVNLMTILQTIRGEISAKGKFSARDFSSIPLNDIARKINQAVGEALGQVTIKDIIEQSK